MHGYPTESLAKNIANLIEASTILTATSTRNARRYTLFAALAVAFAATLRAGDATAQGYVRVGLGASLAAETQFSDVDCASAMPAALYGCGVGGDGAPLSTAGEFAATAGLGIGAGYAVTPALSIELQIDHRPNVPFEGRANFLAPEREQEVRTEHSSLAATVAAMIDLQALWALEIRGFRPFAGVGAGRVRHRLGETRMRFPRTETVVPGGSRTDWTWMLTGGFSRAISERTFLDIAWRYTDRGDAGTAEGAGRVEWRDGSRTLALDLAPTRAKVNQHSIVLSVRYGW